MVALACFRKTPLERCGHAPGKSRPEECLYWNDVKITGTTRSKDPLEKAGARRSKFPILGSWTMRGPCIYRMTFCHNAFSNL